MYKVTYATNHAQKIRVTNHSAPKVKIMNKLGYVAEQICNHVKVIDGANADCCGLLFLGDQAGESEVDGQKVPAFIEIFRVYGVVEFSIEEIKDE